MVKHVPLKSLPAGDTTLPDIVYADVIRECLRRPMDQQKGADITEMRASLRVLDALDSANGSLDLEDADYDHLKAKVIAMPWNVIDRRILTFIDDVTGA